VKEGLEYSFSATAPEKNFLVHLPSRSFCSDQSHYVYNMDRPPALSERLVLHGSIDASIYSVIGALF